MTWEKLGEKIRAARIDRELTQDELAARADLSRIYIAKLEGGDRQVPTLPVLERIAQALGLRLVVDLVGRPKRRRKPRR